jgi:hypothetical protein
MSRDGCRDCDRQAPLDDDGRCDGYALAFARYRGNGVTGFLPDNGSGAGPDRTDPTDNPNEGRNLQWQL